VRRADFYPGGGTAICLDERLQLTFVSADSVSLRRGKLAANHASASCGSAIAEVARQAAE